MNYCYIELMWFSPHYETVETEVLHDDIDDKVLWVWIVVEQKDNLRYICDKAIVIQHEDSQCQEYWKKKDYYNNRNREYRIENHSEHESLENDKLDRFVEVHLMFLFLAMLIPDYMNYTEDNESS